MMQMERIRSYYYDDYMEDICAVNADSYIQSDYTKVLNNYFNLVNQAKYDAYSEDYYLNYVKLEVKKSGSFEMTVTTDSGLSEKVNITVTGEVENPDVDYEYDYYNDPNFFYDSEW